MSLTTDLKMAYHMGYDDALARRKPDDSKVHVFGRGTCHNIAVPDEYSDRPFTCSECGARGPMGNGTYHMASSWDTEHGVVFADSWPVWKFCPACGAEVTNG